MVKSTGSSSRGLGFDFQHLQRVLPPSVIPVPGGSDALSWPPQALYACGTQLYMQAKMIKHIKDKG